MHFVGVILRGSIPKFIPRAFKQKLSEPLNKCEEKKNNMMVFGCEIS